jgi:hypothetical protein
MAFCLTGGRHVTFARRAGAKLCTHVGAFITEGSSIQTVGHVRTGGPTLHSKSPRSGYFLSRQLLAPKLGAYYLTSWFGSLSEPSDKKAAMPSPDVSVTSNDSDRNINRP